MGFEVRIISYLYLFFIPNLLLGDRFQWSNGKFFHINTIILSRPPILLSHFLFFSCFYGRILIRAQGKKRKKKRKILVRLANTSVVYPFIVNLSASSEKSFRKYARRKMSASLELVTRSTRNVGVPILGIVQAATIPKPPVFEWSISQPSL